MVATGPNRESLCFLHGLEKGNDKYNLRVVGAMVKIVYTYSKFEPDFVIKRRGLCYLAARRW